MDAKGSPIQLTGFVRTIVSHRIGSEIFTGEPTVVETPADWIDIGALAPGRPFDVSIPMAIVKEVKLEASKPDAWNLNPHVVARVTLGDGQQLAGSISAIFEGDAGLGKTTLRVEDFEFKEKGIREVRFGEPAETRHVAPAWGKHTVVLHKVDGTTVTIEGAAFVAGVANRNGCWIRDEPAEEMDFEIAGALVKVPWSRIRSVAPSSMKALYDAPDRLLLTDSEGKQTRGHSPPYLRAVGTIRGTVAMGGGYTLRVDVDLGRAGRPLFTAIDFK